MQGLLHFTYTNFSGGRSAAFFLFFREKRREGPARCQTQNPGRLPRGAWLTRGSLALLAAASRNVARHLARNAHELEALRTRARRRGRGSNRFDVLALDGLVAVKRNFVVLGPADRAALPRAAHQLQRRDALDVRAADG